MEMGLFWLGIIIALLPSAAVVLWLAWLAGVFSARENKGIALTYDLTDRGNAL